MSAISPSWPPAAKASSGLYDQREGPGKNSNMLMGRLLFPSQYDFAQGGGPMEIKQLKALHAIAESGSFSAAAGKLRLTQSALSHQIKNLEEELGESLLIRGKPRVVPS